jgi:hypothetical protein
MGVAVLPRRHRRPGPPAGSLVREARRPADRPLRSSGFESAPCAETGGAAATFEDLIADAWEGLSARGRVHCPACGGEVASQRDAMTSCADAPGDVLYGECVGCGTQLC